MITPKVPEIFNYGKKLTSQRFNNSFFWGGQKRPSRFSKP